MAVGASTWIEMHPAPAKELHLPRLGAGERDVIAVAQSVGTSLLLMDDRAGIAAAGHAVSMWPARWLFLSGPRTVKMIDLDSAFTRLRETNYRYRPELLDALLAQYRRRSYA